MMLAVSVHNVPERAKKNKYIVAQFFDGALWFYGAWDDKDKAKSVAYEVEGLLVQNIGTLIEL